MRVVGPRKRRCDGGVDPAARNTWKALTVSAATPSRFRRSDPVTSPFDIEEIFPDDGAAGTAPRRQSGSAPQGMAVTLLADYTLRTRACLPSAAIVALLADTGVTPAGARTAISRLARRGVLEASRQGRHSSYRLTAPAATTCPSADSWIVVEHRRQRTVGRPMDDSRVLTAAERRHAAASPPGPAEMAGIRAPVRRTVDLAARTHPEGTGTAGSGPTRHADRVPGRAARGGGRTRSESHRRLGHLLHRGTVRVLHPALERAAAAHTLRPGERRRSRTRPDRDHGHLSPVRRHGSPTAP